MRALGVTALATLFTPLTCRSADTVGRADVRWRSTLLREHPLAGKIWNAASARFVSQDGLIESLKQAYFRLLGEVHDNPDHHAIQAELLEAIGAAGRRPVVALEQFDREYDSVLQQQLADDTADADAVANAVNFNRKGWNWEFYRPLVEIALRSGA